MNANASETVDPVVDRIRQAREALARQCDYDLDKMVELFKSMQARHPDRVRSPGPSEPRAASKT